MLEINKNDYLEIVNGKELFHFERGPPLLL